jgi:hypothetical protein
MLNSHTERKHALLNTQKLNAARDMFVRAPRHNAEVHTETIKCTCDSVLRSDVSNATVIPSDHSLVISNIHDSTMMLLHAGSTQGRRNTISFTSHTL